MTPVAPQLTLINPETLAVRFPYDAGAVAGIKLLQNRRWNPRKTQWEVHLSHLAELMKIFTLLPAQLPADVLDAYRRDWIRCRLRVHLGPLEGRISGSGAPLNEIDAATSFFLAGYKFSEKFKSGQWDGKRHLFSLRTHKFPAGLWPRIRVILEKHGVEYELEPTVDSASGVPRLRSGYCMDGEAKCSSPSVSEGSISAIQGSQFAIQDPQSPNPQSAIRNPQSVLRDYQQQTLEDALRLGRGIIQLATGGGKTVLAASILRVTPRPAFFFVHTRELLYQAAGVFRRELGAEVGLLGDGQASLRELTVATVQTVLQALGEPIPHKPKKKNTEGGKRKAESKNPRIQESKNISEEDEADTPERYVDLDEVTRAQIREAIEAAKTVIFDECHHVPADGFYKIAMQTRSAAWRFGLSATPWRDDGADLLLEAALGPQICQINCSALIERGFLVPPHIKMLRAPRPTCDLRGEAYQAIYQAAIVENQERNRVIAAHARDWAAAGLSVLILVAHVSHGRALQELLPEANFAYGDLESDLRRQYLRELEQKLHPILIATTLADEGLDIPSLNGVILGGGGKSQTKAFQRIGRALRPAPGKQNARVLDFMDQAPYLKEHSAARLALYRQEPLFYVEKDW